MGTIKLVIVTLAALALSGLPTALAEEFTYDRYLTQNTSPTSGNYLDLSTGLVYSYSTTTGLLTPTGGSGDASGYVRFDVSKRGDVIDPTTAWTGTCPYTVCIAALVTVVGRHEVTGDVDFYDTDGDLCAGAGFTTPVPPAGSLVTFSHVLLGVEIWGWCDHGFADGVLRIDGTPRATDSTTY